MRGVVPRDVISDGTGATGADAFPPPQAVKIIAARHPPAILVDCFTVASSSKRNDEASEDEAPASAPEMMRPDPSQVRRAGAPLGAFDGKSFAYRSLAPLGVRPLCPSLLAVSLATTR